MTDDAFLESLIAAVDAFIETVSAASGARALRDENEEFVSALHKLGDSPAGIQPVEHQGIARIRDHDPHFGIAEFLVRVGQMFSAYHEALDRGDLKPVRRFVDEQSYAQLELAAEKSGRNQSGVRTLTVKAIRPMTATCEDGMDTIRVLITADQSGSDEPLCEYWELIRRQGTLTKPGLDLTHCPNCGGPIDGDDPTRCAYCDTRLADPALDWVVRRISVE